LKGGVPCTSNKFFIYRVRTFGLSPIVVTGAKDN
jgi:hypothetical protein